MIHIVLHIFKSTQDEVPSTQHCDSDGPTIEENQANRQHRLWRRGSSEHQKVQEWISQSPV